ncbi:hypothetical protein [Nostoc sp. ChiVER01]|uniref:hypothetical protein n=1 Tax=Nostoc sp. ChiVER01 TaxID=3075382 RepID=UPI002AD52F2C|nr:hypothetical protein [Nostoc sp. ChiVER01]MDZ8222981.1 hypothetical protein [Nostoc sp. ChiVER01]
MVLSLVLGISLCYCLGAAKSHSNYAKLKLSQNQPPSAFAEHFVPPLAVFMCLEAELGLQVLEELGLRVLAQLGLRALEELVLRVLAQLGLQVLAQLGLWVLE